MEPIRDGANQADQTNVGEGSAATGAATAMQKDDQANAPSEARQSEYVHIGQAFADWFNEKLGLLPDTQIRLGTKTANAVRLHPDGRLECVLSGVEGEGATQFVAFEAKYLDQLVRKIGALGL